MPVMRETTPDMGYGGASCGASTTPIGDAVVLRRKVQGAPISGAIMYSKAVPGDFQVPANERDSYPRELDVDRNESSVSNCSPR